MKKHPRSANILHNKVNTEQILKFSKVRINPQINIPTKSTSLPKYNEGNQNYLPIIHELRKELYQLKSVVKKQQTRLTYYENEDKKIIKKDTSQSETNIIMKLKSLQSQLKKKEQEINQLKHSIQATTIKQLRIENQQLLLQIKNLSCKNYNNEKKACDLNYLNKLISKQHHTSTLNQSLKQQLYNVKAQMKSLQQQQEKIIRKLKNTINMKNKYVQEKQNELNELKNCLKTKRLLDSDNYVHKNQLEQRKKQMLVLMQIIESLEKKVIDYEGKIQQIKNQNIEKINLEVNKRKEILNNYQQLLTKYDDLKKGIKTPSLLTQTQYTRQSQLKISKDHIFKKRNPVIVQIQEIQDIADQLVYNLQINNISLEEFIDTLSKHQDEISIGNIMMTLSADVYNISHAHDRQLLARYLVETGQQKPQQPVNYNQTASISVIFSILKRLLNNYKLFSQLHLSLNSKIQSQLQRKKNIIVQKIHLLKQKGNEYDRNIWIQVLQNCSQLGQDELSFVRHKTHKYKNIKLSYEKMLQIFNEENEQ